MPAQTSPIASTPSDLEDLADLTALAAELDRHGLKAELRTPGKLPYLHVSNPQASVLTERASMPKRTRSGSPGLTASPAVTNCPRPPPPARVRLHHHRLNQGEGP